MLSWISGSRHESEDTSSRVSSLCGYLWKMKRSHHRMILVPQWNKRWFSIEGRLLKWYAAASSDHSSDMVDLRFITNVAAFEAHGVYSFVLSYPDRNILLRAANSSDMDKWIRALQFQADVARGGCGMTIVTASNTSGSNPQGKGRAMKEKYRPPTLEASLEATMVRLQILESSVMRNQGRIDSGITAESEDSNHVDDSKDMEKHREKTKKRPPKENSTRSLDDKGYSPSKMGTRGLGQGQGQGQVNYSAEYADQIDNRVSGKKSKSSSSLLRNNGDEDEYEDEEEERRSDKAGAKSSYSSNSERKCADSSDMRSESDSKESSNYRLARYNSDESRADDIKERRRDNSRARESSRGRESKTPSDPRDLEEIMPVPRSRSHRSRAAADKKKDRGESLEESNLVSSSSSSSRSAGSRSAGRGGGGGGGVGGGGGGLPPPVKQGNWGYGEEDSYKDISDFEGGISRRQYHALSVAAVRAAGEREKGAGERSNRGSEFGGGSSRVSRMSSVEDAVIDFDDLPEVDLKVRKPNQRAVRETNRQLERDRTVRRDSMPRSLRYASDERERERERSSDRICGSHEIDSGSGGNGWV